MNTKRLIDLIFLPLEKVLSCIGSVLNQCPTKDECKKLRTSPIFNNPFRKKPQNNFDLNKKSNYKQDYHAKGPKNSDARIFNKARR